MRPSSPAGWCGPPFARCRIEPLQQLQVGTSFDTARIDTNNVSLEAKTAGLTSFLKVVPRAKFNIIREADERNRFGAELGWAHGPLAIMGEYCSFRIPTIRTSATSFSFHVKDYYLSCLYMLTGDRPRFEHGLFQGVRPERGLGDGGWGSLGVGFRYDAFAADESIYDTLIDAGVSVRKAVATSYSLIWYMTPSAKILVDATSTRFDRPLLVGRDALQGTALYSTREKVFTGRFQLAF